MPPIDDQPPRRREADLAVLEYALQSLQASVDRGIGGLEKTMDKGFDGIASRLDRLEERQKTTEELRVYDAARIKALEEFRAEQDRREAERRRSAEQELAAATDNSANWKTARWIGAALVGVFSIIGVIVAIAGNL